MLFTTTADTQALYKVNSNVVQLANLAFFGDAPLFVPERGSALLLLGLSAAGLGFVKLRFRRR